MADSSKHSETTKPSHNQADNLDEFCERHQSKLIDHVYWQMLADTYGLSDDEAKSMAGRVADRFENLTKGSDLVATDGEVK